MFPMENNTYRPGAVTAQNNAAQAGIIPDTGCLCDNLQALTAVASHGRARLGQCDRINHAYVHTALKPLLPGSWR